MQQSTVCFHIAWRTTSVGRLGVAACLACVTTVLSCLVMTAGQVRLAPECVRRSQCAARHNPTQARRRTHLSGCRADLVHTATPDTTKQSCLCRVWCDGVNWTIAINLFKLQIFYRRRSRVAGQFTPLKRARHRQDSFVVSGVVV